MNQGKNNTYKCLLTPDCKWNNYFDHKQLQVRDCLQLRSHKNLSGDNILFIVL